MSPSREQVAELLTDYAWLLDNDRLEEWVELFTEDARYSVVPRENRDQGLSLGLLSCRNKAMLRDRILALRVANEYNIHYDRHIVGLPRVIERTGESLRIEANYLVLQSDQGGNTRVFSTGAYHDTLLRSGDRLLIREKLVVVDTFCVPSLIATPL